MTTTPDKVLGHIRSDHEKLVESARTLASLDHRFASNRYYGAATQLRRAIHDLEKELKES